MEGASATSETGTVGASRQPPSAATAAADSSDGETWAHTVRANVAIVRRRVLFFIVVTLLFLVAAVLVDRGFPPMYSSAARVVIAPYRDRIPTLDAAVTPVQVNELGFMQTQLEIVRSASLIVAVAQAEHLEDSINELSTPFDHLAELVGRIVGGDPASGSNAGLARAAVLLAAREKVNVVKDASVLHIQVSTRDAALSKRLTQRVIDKYVEVTGKERTQRLEAGATTLRERQAAQSDAVDKAVAALSAFDVQTAGVRRTITSETETSTRPASSSSSSTQTEREQTAGVRRTTSETETSTRPTTSSSSNTQTEREDTRLAEREQLDWKVFTERALYQLTSTNLENIRAALDTLRTVSLVTVLDAPAAATSPDGLKSWMRYLMYIVAAPLFGLFATYVLYLMGVYRRSGRKTTVTT